MDWFRLAQDTYKRRALVEAVIYVRVPSGAGKFLSGCKIGGLTNSAQLHRLSAFEING
jgi:hypothetical protein